MLPGTEEEGAVDQGIPVEDEELFLAQNAVHLGTSLGGQRGQDEATGVVVAVVAFILGLKKIYVKVHPIDDAVLGGSCSSLKPEIYFKYLLLCQDSQRRL